MDRRVLIAGNWKMNKTPQETEAFIKQLLSAFADEPKPEVLIVPPFTSLDRAGRLSKGSWIELGAQDLYYETSGAFTGAVSGAMLAACHCRYVLVGHSERRHVFGDNDADVLRKMHAAIDAGLHPILCIGETLAQRTSGETEAVLVRQLSAVAEALRRAGEQGVTYAYEPVWAIGTGETATPEQAQSAIARVRAWIDDELSPSAAASARILYGGSMKPGNAQELLERPDIDGGLIGGASLDSDSFARIIEIATSGG